MNQPTQPLVYCIRPLQNAPHETVIREICRQQQNSKHVVYTPQAAASGLQGFVHKVKLMAKMSTI